MVFLIISGLCSDFFCSPEAVFLNLTTSAERARTGSSFSQHYLNHFYKTVFEITPPLILVFLIICSFP